MRARLETRQAFHRVQQSLDLLSFSKVHRQAKQLRFRGAFAYS